MYKIYFYKNQKGKMPVHDYLNELRCKNDKSSRIKANKINDYIEILSQHGLAIGEPFIKHLEGEIWELRPICDRILFVAWVDQSFVLLHVFMKRTQKTPKKEINKAKEELADLIARGVDNEK